MGRKEKLSLRFTTYYTYQLAPYKISTDKDKQHTDTL